MAPRKYELGQRAATMEATRLRIVEATIALHREQGIVATSYRDIARRADVGVGTVYHHFPTIDDLVMACGGRLLELTQPPTAEVFAGIRSRRRRVERLTSELFGWYERYPAWRRAICDADKLDVLARGVQRRQGIVSGLVTAALGADATDDAVTTVGALLDYEVYRHLIAAGRSREEAAATIAAVVNAWL